MSRGLGDVYKRQVKGVLDIDSNLLNSFDETDRRYLEEVTAIVAKTLYY